jgi:hypothetical protein
MTTETTPVHVKGALAAKDGRFKIEAGSKFPNAYIGRVGLLDNSNG